MESYRFGGRIRFSERDFRLNCEKDHFEGEESFRRLKNRIRTERKLDLADNARLLLEQPITCRKRPDPEDQRRQKERNDTFSISRFISLQIHIGSVLKQFLVPDRNSLKFRGFPPAFSLEIDPKKGNTFASTPNVCSRKPIAEDRARGSAPLVKRLPRRRFRIL